MTEYDTQYGDIVFAPDDLDENDPFEELPSYTILSLKLHNLSGLICVKLRCLTCLASAQLHPPPCFTQIILGNLCELLIKVKH